MSSSISMRPFAGLKAATRQIRAEKQVARRCYATTQERVTRQPESFPAAQPSVPKAVSDATKTFQRPGRISNFHPGNIYRGHRGSCPVWLISHSTILTSSRSRTLSLGTTDSYSPSSSISQIDLQGPDRSIHKITTLRPRPLRPQDTTFQQREPRARQRRRHPAGADEERRPIRRRMSECTTSGHR